MARAEISPGPTGGCQAEKAKAGLEEKSLPGDTSVGDVVGPTLTGVPEPKTRRRDREICFVQQCSGVLHAFGFNLA